MNKADIREGMAIVCSENKQFAEVDRIEGEFIKVTKDDEGNHHWFPLAWVTNVDDKVHVDRPGQQAMQEWSDEAPTLAA